MCSSDLGEARMSWLYGIFGLAVVVFMTWTIIKGSKQSLPAVRVRSGWMYFATISGENEAPVRIRDWPVRPTAALLNESGISPYPVQLLHTFRCENVSQVLMSIYYELEPAHIQGWWYERDAALCYLDTIQQEAADGQTA